MKTVVVNQNGKTFSAISGKNKSFGKTVGEAIDALTKQIPDEPNPVIYIQDFQPDEFFTAQQQTRLAELMQKLRDTELELSVEEKSELENLINVELDGSAKRAAKIAEKLGK